MKGMVLSSIEFRWKEGIAELTRAEAGAQRQRAPGRPGCVPGAFGEIDEALRLVRQAQEADPLDITVLVQRGESSTGQATWIWPVRPYTKVLELSPGTASVHSSLGLVYLRQGMGPRAIEECLKEEKVGYREYALAAIYHALGMHAESDASMERLHREGEAWAFQFASAHAFRGEADEAFHWLQRSYDLHDSGLLMVKMSWLCESLHSDPRWRSSWGRSAYWSLISSRRSAGVLVSPMDLDRLPIQVRIGPEHVRQHRGSLLGRDLALLRFAGTVPGERAVAKARVHAIHVPSIGDPVEKALRRRSFRGLDEAAEVLETAGGRVELLRRAGTPSHVDRVLGDAVLEFLAMGVEREARRADTSGRAARRTRRRRIEGPPAARPTRSNAPDPCT